MSSLQDYYYAQLDDWEARFAALDAAHDVVQPDPVHEALTARFDRYARLRKSPLDARTRTSMVAIRPPVGFDASIRKYVHPNSFQINYGTTGGSST